METEIWKDIEGFEGLYQVSNLGKIKSLPKMRGFAFQKEKILTNNKDSYGYEYVALSKENKIKIELVHRLVAQAFIPNLDNKPQVNHKDGNKRNNNVSNLEWCTDKENKIHRLMSGIYVPKKGTRKIKEINQYDKDGNYLKTFKNTKEINQKFGYSISHIHKCCKGVYKTSYGFVWRYNEANS